MTESYLRIQMIRYSDRLQYSIDIPKELLPYPIPKLTLEPLVENAIYHGIREHDMMGEIRLTGRLEDGVCYVCVKDSGCGIDEEKLEHIRESKNSGGHESGFGLSSIQARLTMMFGDAYGLTIESKLGEGTCVVVSFPALPRGADR